MELENWLINNRLKYNSIFKNKIFNINEEYFIVIEPKENLLFDEDFDIILDDNERSLIEKFKVNNYLFEFGGKWYYSNISKEKIELNLFKYIGNADLKEVYDFPYLGIHGKYDLCNGSRDYKDWVKKAKFLGITTLGICETNTLAGTLAFQEACKEENVDFIIGEEVLVKDKKNNDEFFIKLYVKNQNGWENLLLINTEINVHNSEEQYISIERLFELSADLICIITFENNSLIKKFKKHFTDIYYQFDTVEYLSDEKDKEHLLNLKKYLELKIDIQPVFIFDSYYLDKEDGHIRYILNKIGKTKFHNQSHDQYFKSLDDILIQMIPLFREDDSSFDDIINKGLENLTQIKEECKFEIDTKTLHLPEYEMTNEEKKKFKTNEDLFWHLIEKGLVEKKLADEDIYIDRVQIEVDVIKKGGFIDYFLILWDIINWCNKNDILTGVGRGSAAGSLVSYLLGLVKINPIKYDLLFERFLNEGRLKGSLPDIDLDFPGNKRDDIKRYIEERYGIEQVASIGTYSTFKMRAVIKDFSRLENISPQTVNYFTAMINADSSLNDFFREAASKPRLKQFIRENTELINNIPLCFEQPKNQSIHAAGVIITPKKDNKNIYTQLPVKKIDGVLISEWEGGFIEKAGYLKADILGIRQLEKFKHIFDLVEENRGEKLFFEKIPLDEVSVYSLFQEGLNEDVFQFGALGLKGYCKTLKPDNIEDLIATVALYRPGPIEIGAHMRYVKIKNGDSFPEYYPHTKKITQGTYSNIVYQEQVMSICSEVGGFSLVEADDVRRAMGKKDVNKMQGYRDKFIRTAVEEKGYSQIEVTQLWNKLEHFAEYCFNRSHAAAYAHTGYYSQYLKWKYSLEFWLTSLKYSSDDELPSRVNEIHKISTIKILPPEINNSSIDYVGDIEKNVIYWSLSSIKFVSEKSSESILNEREKNGSFYSLEEFYKRVEKRTVNKRVIFNLILSGAFDGIENINSPIDRFKLIKDFCTLTDSTLPEEFSADIIWKEYFWVLKQKQLSGLGYIDYKKIYNSTKLKSKFIEPEDFYNDDNLGYDKSIGGILTEIIERNSKRGNFAQLILEQNNELLNCIVWSEIWPEHKKNILDSKGKIIFITGELKWDNFRQCNILQTDEKTKIVTI